MHLTALVESPDHVCCRYRLAALRPFLRQAGHTLECCSWPTSTWSALSLLPQLAQADAVIIQRQLLPLWQLWLLRRKVRRLIYDFDDALFLRDSYSIRGQHSFRRRHRFAAMIRAADAVAAGNVFLGIHAGRWTVPQRVHVVPTCVDPDRYPLADHHRSGNGVRLVWVGSASTLQGLEVVQPLLEEIGQRCPGVCLKLICDRFLHLERMPVLTSSWSEATEAEEIASSDIGISWLPDDSWSRGKCGLKVLQYMAAGLPVVANPVGVQAEMVRHGVTGFLAESGDQWVNAINRLAGDPELRRRMGAVARKVVEADFTVAGAARLWRELLANLEQTSEAA